jgi:hypothetical protein
MDFYKIRVKEIENGPRKGELELYPDFIVGRSSDLMVRGGKFYAIWDEERNLWSTDEYDVQRLVDADLRRYAKEQQSAHGVQYSIRDLQSFSTNGWNQFRKFVNNIGDNSRQLDENLTFANTEVKKSDHVSRRLPYSLEAGEFSAWNELVGTLYPVEERAKIEWAIGAVLSGDAKKIQKFLVFYGAPSTGKGTVLDIIQKMFVGYTTTFDAKALGSGGSDFATEVFKNNPLVAIQHDGDLSRIMDNTKLNSIISHEDMTMNEKYKSSYTARIIAFLFMGTNQPVKISDAKSGIIRRLIDVHPTGIKIPVNHYFTLMSRIDFELGAIAHHCLEVYLGMGKNYYNGYRPLEMMLQTDVFFNFIEANFDIFKAQDGTTLKQAYSLYKEYCADTGIQKERVLPQYKFREELRNYFEKFHERYVLDGNVVRSFYEEFSAHKFKTESKKDNTFSLVIEENESLFDREFSGQPAQGATSAETPKKKWSEVTTTLADIDTKTLHFVKVPEDHIVIDFDLKDSDGTKSLERNLEAASVWPPTYAELSKSGSGVHLHYIYDGDTSELSNTYAEGIEVKVYRGDASLRRLLSKCNSVPISTLSGGLPIKEKKMLGAQTIQSEKGLRDLIARNLRKEIHPGTKPSIDFIKKILDDAYESGMSYDVTDLRNKIMAFANNSTNQPFQCLKIVQSMRFKAMEIEADADVWTEFMAKDDRLVIFDVEVYPNLFVICWKFRGDANIVRMINPSPQEVEQLFRLKLVGFNCRRYDNHIMYARMLGYNNQQLFELSQKMIVQNDHKVMFGEAYNISYADIWDFSSKKQTLKRFQIELGIKHKELDFPWDEPVDEKDWPTVVDYCCNDVVTTEAVLQARWQDFVARQILAELSGLSINDTTQRHTARIIFGNERNPQKEFQYTPLENDFPGYTFDMGKSHYRGELVGEGGYVYAEPGMYNNVVELDIASMHPTSIEQLSLFGDYTSNFSALKDARIAIKHGDYESARTMLDGKLAPYLTDEKQAESLSYALKIVINIVYGLTSAKFENPFKDPRNIDNIVAKRGALFMIDLKHEVQKRGHQVVHIKTDSIKIPNATPEIVEFVCNYGEKYGYDFEHEATYDKFCLVNDAVYIAHVDWAEKASKIGKWVAVGAQFQHPYVFKTLFSGEPITFDDLCETKQVIQGAMYLDFEHNRPAPLLSEGWHFVGRIGRFVPVKEGFGGGMLYRVKDGKHYAVSGTKNYLWVEAEMGAKLLNEDEINMHYFEGLVEEAKKTIEKFGNFEDFIH